MAKSTKPKKPNDSQNDRKSQKVPTKHGGMTNKQIEHQYKLSLMRECQIYGKLYAETSEYFKSKGFTLGHTQFTELRNELKSSKSAKDWFSKEALYVIEEDHMVSVERMRLFENTLVNKTLKLINDDDFETKTTFITTDSGVTSRVKNYNFELYLKSMAEFRAIQETKTKMFSATPMVQEMLEIHRRREEEEQAYTKPPEPAKQEKEIAT